MYFSSTLEAMMFYSYLSTFYSEEPSVLDGLDSFTFIYIYILFYFIKILIYFVKRTFFYIIYNSMTEALRKIL